ncbi:MAG: hypothetical protein LKF41_05415 [Bifidobacterium sp.]|jgi:Ser/Thr protein kinase RdoA (MazF antagonist)|nr:hypothetical protein [Bifidobacterium sp.]MCH4175280.1 hypothetical protein [Bifidobacterium sp.]
MAEEATNTDQTDVEQTDVEQTETEHSSLQDRFPKLNGIEDQDFDTQIASYSEVLRILEQDLQQRRN